MSDEKTSVFSREGYAMIASALNQAMLESRKGTDPEWVDGFTTAAVALAHMFEEDNPRFSYIKFFNDVNQVEKRE